MRDDAKLQITCVDSLINSHVRLSPLLLVPVCLERIGATAPWKLSLYEDEITPNFCLRELMKRDFRLQSSAVDPQALLDDEPARESYETAVQVAVRHESD